MVTEGEFPICTSIADKLIGSQAITVYRGVQYRLRPMPQVLAPAFEGVENFKVFKQWYDALNKATDLITNLSEEQQQFQSVTVQFVQSVNRDITHLFNTLLATIDDQGASVVSFIDNAGAAFDWLQSDDGADIRKLFQEIESEYLRHQYVIMDDNEISKVNQNGEILGPIGATDQMRYCWVATRVTTVHYRDSLLGKHLNLPVGKVCNVEYKLTPDFYNACARIVRLRNSRMRMDLLLMTDSLGHQIQILAGKRDGGQIRVKTYNG